MNPRPSSRVLHSSPSEGAPLNADLRAILDRAARPTAFPGAGPHRAERDTRRSRRDVPPPRTVRPRRVPGRG
ncbi:hypothetical protein [Actinomadura kijaniata]|uniref:hypothetical protein n=1 Tax=Actinomadura kijaniata TaxID=46161 RepID=UPI0008309349|nr:hypothetical protein [Actinomadura kijaniata]